MFGINFSQVAVLLNLLEKFDFINKKLTLIKSNRVALNKV